MYDYRPVYRAEVDRDSRHPNRLSTTAFMIWLVNYSMLIAITGTLFYVVL